MCLALHPLHVSLAPLLVGMAMQPREPNYLQRRWATGIWVGRRFGSTTNLVIAEDGALEVRTIRCMPMDRELVEDASPDRTSRTRPYSGMATRKAAASACSCGRARSHTDGTMATHKRVESA